MSKETLCEAKPWAWVHIANNKDTQMSHDEKEATEK